MDTLRVGHEGAKPEQCPMSGAVRDTYRHATLLRTDKLQDFPTASYFLIEQPQRSEDLLGTSEPLRDLWATVETQDEMLSVATAAVRDGASRFPIHLNLKVSISECSLE